MKKFLRFAALWSLTVFALLETLPAASPVVSNIRAAQRPGTKLIDIYYDLADTDGDEQVVQITASSDGGLTYGLPCVTLSGAVGPGVTPGQNRHIVWDAGADWGGNFVANCRVRVTTSDGTTFGAPPGMASIPAGPFQRGDNFTEGATDERPVHIVQMPGFFIDRTEVTRELWEQVKTWGNNNGYSIGGGSWNGVGHPVHSIDWYDAVKWCNARSEREGLTPCYYTDDGHTSVYRSGDVNLENSKVDWSADGYRLPTEAEWEMAARGGRTGQRFPHGDTISHADANFRNSGGESYQTGTTSYHPTYGSSTAPVGSFAANDYGLHDMAGNLWEWCWDRYDDGYYASPSSLSDPKGSDSGSSRVLRGGSWRHYALYCRCAERNNYSPGYTRSYYGFRTVRR